MVRGFKPPYSYIVLIGMAIRERGGKANVGDIYDFITTTFPYFRTANPVWNTRRRCNRPHPQS